VNELAWTYNSDYIITATNNEGYGSIDLLTFSGEEMEVVESIVAHSSNCFNLKIDPTFQKIALGSADQCISIWNLENLISINTLTME
jgi:WD40 repeat protein